MRAFGFGYSFGFGQRREAQTYSPLAEFGAGEQGYFLQFSDFGTMFQDIAGNTPVTAVGQPVGQIRDRTGNAYIFASSVDARRPTLVTEAGCFGLQFDGTDDCLLSTVSVNPGAVDKCQIFLGVRKAISAARMVFEASANAAANVGSLYLVAGTDTGALGTTIDGYTSFGRGQTGGADATAQIARAAPDTCILALTHDIAADLSTIRRNGVAGTSATGDKGIGNFGSHVHFIGARADASLRFQGVIWGGMFMRFGPNLAVDRRALLEGWFASRTPGVTL